MKWLFDVKYAYRMLVKNPGFTSLTVSVMAAGLGLCVFMLAFLSSIVLRPLPFEQGEHIYVIETEFDGVRYNGGSTNLHDYQAIKEQSNSYDSIGAYQPGTANLSNGDRAQRYSASFVDSNIFAFTSTSPLMGRAFNDQDLFYGAPHVTVLGYNIWKTYFAQSPNILGQLVKINGISTEIIGVMPKGYEFPVSADLWLPMPEDASRIARDQAPSVSIYVKKKPEVSLAQADQELKAIMKVIEQKYPETNSKTTAYITSFQKNFMGNGADVIVGIMLTAVIFVLALACINVGNLLLARANERAKETAIRVALGAPKGRLIMQMMWESVFICTLGGLFGLFLAAFSLELLNEILPNMLPIAAPFWWQMSLDSVLVLQSLIIIITTALITGIVPAWKMTRGDFNAVLRDGTRGATGKKSGRLNRILVIVEVSLSCVLLTLSAVLFIVLQEVNNVHYGANIENKLTARVGLPLINYKDDDKKQQYFQRLMDKLSAMPAVKNSGALSSMPGSGTWYASFQPEGFEVTDSQYPHTGRVVSFVGSMQALDMKLLEGRYFDSRDRKDSQPVAIITDSMAEKYWPNESALGKRFKFVEGDDHAWLTIVGIVPHVIHGQPYSLVKNRITAYRPYTQEKRRFMTTFVNTQNDPAQHISAYTTAIANIDPEVPGYDMSVLTERIKRNTGGMTFMRDLFAVFALCALLLASSGIYGVLANSTSRRTQEIGIRRAIGATDEKVLNMLMKQGWQQLAIGLAFGLPLSYLVSLGIVQLVGPETNNHYYAFIVIPTIITFVVSFATFIPAKKAIKLEPSTALRYE